jgi:signal peptidase I
MENDTLSWCRCDGATLGRRAESTEAKEEQVIQQQPQDQRVIQQQQQAAQGQRRFRFMREVLETIILTVLMFLVIRFAVQNYRIDGVSMQPTLHNNEFILVDKASYYFHPPNRGDIIVFKWPLDTNQDFIKRVIGVPGDRVQVTASGQVIVDGHALQEPYTAPAPDPYQPTSITLKANQYFVMGDNRGDSSDSRIWGPVPTQDIIGRAVLVYWPLHDAEIIPGAGSVFAAVH